MKTILHKFTISFRREARSVTGHVYNDMSPNNWAQKSVQDAAWFVDHRDFSTGSGYPVRHVPTICVLRKVLLYLPSHPK